MASIEFQLAFSEKVRKGVKRETAFCPSCRDIAPPGAIIEAHSMTGLHLQRVKTSDGWGYRVTDPPPGNEVLKDRVFSLAIGSLFGDNGGSDAVGLCPECHSRIHRLAIAICRSEIAGFKGNVPSSEVLAGVTQVFLKRGREITEAIHNGDNLGVKTRESRRRRLF